MARFLAVDWDEGECRYLFASVQKGTATVRKTGTISLELSESSDRDASPTIANADIPALISAVRRLAKEERIDPCPTLLSLGRNKLEAVYLTLPPCQESEIPILLRNQLFREFSGFSEFDPVDYLVLDDSTGTERKVLALTIPLSFRQNLVRSFRSLGRAPQRIGFRAVSAAELILRNVVTSDTDEPVLILNAVGNDIDLVLAEGGRIVSVRSVRLPTQLRFAETVPRIAEEIQRTVTIGTEETGNAAIHKVYLYGAEDDWSPLVEVLAERRLEASVVNPFALPGITADVVPEFPGRFAPLVGLVLDQQRPARIDLLHPKEPPKVANRVRTVLLTLALLVVAGFGLYQWNRSVIRNMEAELLRLETEYKDVSAQYQQVQPTWYVLQQARNWEAQGIVWLDEFRDLSAILPGEQDLVVSRISFTPMETNPRFSGMIQLSGMVRDPSVLLALQRNLQANGIYQMRYPAPSANPAGGGYPWLFQTSILRIRR